MIVWSRIWIRGNFMARCHCDLLAWGYGWGAHIYPIERYPDMDNGIQVTGAIFLAFGPVYLNVECTWPLEDE